MGKVSFFLGLKRPRRVVNHPLQSIAEVIERVHLHIFPLCVFVTGYRVKLTFYFFPFVLFYTKHTKISQRILKDTAETEVLYYDCIMQI